MSNEQAPRAGGPGVCDPYSVDALGYDGYAAIAAIPRTVEFGPVSETLGGGVMAVKDWLATRLAALTAENARLAEEVEKLEAEIHRRTPSAARQLALEMNDRGCPKWACEAVYALEAECATLTAENARLAGDMSSLMNLLCDEHHKTTAIDAGCLMCMAASAVGTATLKALEAARAVSPNTNWLDAEIQRLQAAPGGADA